METYAYCDGSLRGALHHTEKMDSKVLTHTFSFYMVQPYGQNRSPKTMGCFNLCKESSLTDYTPLVTLEHINLITQSHTAQKMTNKSCNIEIKMKLMQKKCESHK